LNTSRGWTREPFRVPPADHFDTDDLILGIQIQDMEFLGCFVLEADFPKQVTYHLSTADLFVLIVEL
jgi:hypothetical protein